MLSEQLVIEEGDQTIERSLLQTVFDSEVHVGNWYFVIRACVDRRNEEFGALDCEKGLNLL